MLIKAFIPGKALASGLVAGRLFFYSRNFATKAHTTVAEKIDLFDDGSYSRSTRPSYFSRRDKEEEDAGTGGRSNGEDLRGGESPRRFGRPEGRGDGESTRRFGRPEGRGEESSRRFGRPEGGGDGEPSRRFGRPEGRDDGESTRRFGRSEGRGGESSGRFGRPEGRGDGESRSFRSAGSADREPKPFRAESPHDRQSRPFRSERTGDREARSFRLDARDDVGTFFGSRYPGNRNTEGGYGGSQRQAWGQGTERSYRPERRESDASPYEGAERSGRSFEASTRRSDSFQARERSSSRHRSGASNLILDSDDDTVLSNVSPTADRSGVKGDSNAVKEALHEQIGDVTLRKTIVPRRSDRAAIPADEHKEGNGKTASPSKGMRLARRIALAGVASRRGAEVLIAEGKVSVNNTVITSPAINVQPEDKIVCEGKVLPAIRDARLFIVDKLRGEMVTRTDPDGKPTVFQRFKVLGLPDNLVTVGRLDFMTEGLLLATTSGDIAQYLERPGAFIRVHAADPDGTRVPDGADPQRGISRVYIVKVYGRHIDRAIIALKNGAVIEGIQYQPAGVEMISRKEKKRIADEGLEAESEDSAAEEADEVDGNTTHPLPDALPEEKKGVPSGPDPDDTAAGGKLNPMVCWLKITLYEGKNREIRNILEHFGLVVNRLVRKSYGPFTLKGIPKGSVLEVPVPKWLEKQAEMYRKLLGK